MNTKHPRLTKIPAPPSAEAPRAQAVKVLLAAVGLEVHIDKTGNVTAELRAANEKEIVLLAAHMDPVFPAGTDVKVRRDKTRLSAAGISDNGTGLVSLVALARALHEARIKPQRTILFVADVGEEGEGNLRGMRALVDAYRDRLKADVSDEKNGALRLDAS